LDPANAERLNLDGGLRHSGRVVQGKRGQAICEQCGARGRLVGLLIAVLLPSILVVFAVSPGSES